MTTLFELAASDGASAPEARQALADLGDVAAAELASILTEHDHFRRGIAAEVLGLFEPTDQVLAALTMALDDAYPYVRLAAANSTGAVGDDRFVSALVERWSHETHPRVQEVMLRAMVDLDPERTRGPLMEALENADADVRHEAVEGLRRLGDSDGATALERALAGDPDDGVRDAAALALLARDSATGAGWLRRRLTDVDGLVPDEQAELCDLIAQIEGVAATDLLRLAADHPYEPVRAVAGEALRGRGATSPDG